MEGLLDPSYKISMHLVQEQKLNIGNITAVPAGNIQTIGLWSPSVSWRARAPPVAVQIVVVSASVARTGRAGAAVSSLRRPGSAAIVGGLPLTAITVGLAATALGLKASPWWGAVRSVRVPLSALVSVVGPIVATATASLSSTRRGTISLSWLSLPWLPWLSWLAVLFLLALSPSMLQI